MHLTLIFLLLAVVFLRVPASGQADSTGRLTVGGYFDGYVGHYFGKADGGNIPYFVNSARSGEFNVNLAYIDVKYQSRLLRARIAPGFGTYINSNYAAEPGALKHLIEAYTGIKLARKREIWLDFGVFTSPYTNESCISKDHLMYTRALAPEYVPYYLSGAKLTLPLSGKLSLYVYALNGWQQIQDANKGKALGTQLEWKPSSASTITLNTFIGDERSDAAPQNRMRYFADIYWAFNKGKWSATACAYWGIQERLLGRRRMHAWGQANAVLRYSFADDWSISGRIEYFHDPNSVQIAPINPVIGFSTFGAGCCLNRKIEGNALWRLEYRQFLSGQEVYKDTEGQASRQVGWLVSSLAIWF